MNFNKSCYATVSFTKLSVILEIDPYVISLDEGSIAATSNFQGMSAKNDSSFHRRNSQNLR